jgi:polyphenol oxidase
MTPQPVIEHYAALDAQPWLRSGFVCRDPGVYVALEKDAALAALEKHHAAARTALGLENCMFVTAEQIHGAEVALVDQTSMARVAGVDALITADPRACLGIYVADCCAVFLTDPVHKAVGLAHSGKKGTDHGIVPATIAAMRANFGSNPANLIVQLSPCIRPPDYETDFAAEIVRQCKVAGVCHVFDCGRSTAADLARYYSYRVEKGKTGRMLALLAIV